MNLLATKMEEMEEKLDEIYEVVQQLL